MDKNRPKKPRTYTPWTNKRVDDALKGRHLKRIGQVTVWNEKVKILCQICGQEFSSIPQNLEAGSGCPYCYRESKKGVRKKVKWDIDEVKKLAKEAGFEVLEKEYVNNNYPMRVKDLITGEILETNFRNIQYKYSKQNK